MITFCYNLLAMISIIFVVPYHLYRSITRGRPSALAQRFGFIPAADLEKLEGSDVVWIHAVSVGETIAAVPLIKALRRRYPHIKLVLSNVTETGREVAGKIAGVDLCLYFPFDYPFAVNGSLRKVSPSLILIMETELWPNFIRAANQRGIPVLLVNGRISDKSFHRYLRFKWFFQPILANISALCMQSAEDARRITAMGASATRVQISRNLKYDIAPPLQTSQNRAELRRRYLIPEDTLVFTAGSTHNGEDEMVLEAYRAVLNEGAKAFMVLAPRHPERALQVAELLSRAGFSATRRSALDTRRELFASGEVLLLDTVGELLNVYAVSDLVFVGGSLVPNGGHNVLEPASLRVPVLFGPHMNNFKEIAALLLEFSAGVRVADVGELAVMVSSLLADREKRLGMGDNGARLLAENSGSTERHMAVIEQFLGSGIGVRGVAQLNGK
jgi:3-deoxy-D-manno-octulosonic-acid transferase